MLSLTKKLHEKNHLPLLDLLRYLCAVAILIWHYQHFFLLDPGNTIANFKLQDQPFWNLLNIPYKTGFNAVPLFWILSGIVLSKSYLDVNTDLKRFFINRLARLYPLHIVTLVFVLAIQYFSILSVGYPQIYENNSLGNFLKNLVFINDGSNFNAPIWSVSVEIFSYIVFSLLIFRQAFRKTSCLFLILSFFAVSQIQISQLSFLQLELIGKCGMYFFCGVFMYLLTKTLPISILALLAISSFVIGINLRSNSYFVLMIGIALSCLVLENFLNFGPRLRDIFQTLGNLTYATYLIHIPLQIVVLIYIQKAGLDQLTLVTNEYFFVLWFLILHIASYVTYRKFEIPSRMWIKRRFNV
jgi:peptidoglycan/LPS O-acetylase OafA/YrhL